MSLEPRQNSKFSLYPDVSDQVEPEPKSQPDDPTYMQDLWNSVRFSRERHEREFGGLFLEVENPWDRSLGLTVLYPDGSEEFLDQAYLDREFPSFALDMSDYDNWIDEAAARSNPNRALDQMKRDLCLGFIREMDTARRLADAIRSARQSETLTPAEFRRAVDQLRLEREMKDRRPLIE